ncbi:exo-beta-N-acetylmuramidase NamZ domain-containing protein [Nonomuraea sp. M3C6]|uniref:Exo-beta-N-acetylmuramidase NamZ domain-containing protein n=1 Tax=Nonomuraea marmarensis TaxID=3351344 RepID=A0ABW7APZ6_9ACTN
MGHFFSRRVLLSSAAVAMAGTGMGIPPLEDRPRHRNLETGVQVLMADDYELVQGQKVGIVTNPTGILPDRRHEVDVMAATDKIDLVAVFGPEHGFRGTAQAGGSEGFYLDEQTGLPVYDTYLTSGQALADIFTRSGVDSIMFDIQDAGARFYTYIWTMFDSMQAAALAGKRFVVLDRPNPITGRRAYGPVMTPQFSTFIGREAISQAHGLTVGELARLFNAEFLGGRVDLTVVEMRGWKRDQAYEDTGLPWVLPSPNMPTVDTALVYSGTGMFEGTNLSEGRGTTRPFELIGAPYVDHRWANALNELGLPGAGFRLAYFTPTFSKHVNKLCGGVQLYVTDQKAFDPVKTGIAMIVTAKRLYPDDFAWRYDTSDPARPYWIDKMTGSTQVRTDIDGGKGPDEVESGWADALKEFATTRQKYLIYRGGN